MNSVMMIATLTRDPELIEHGETKVCEMRVAELKGGGRPLFINAAAFGRQAENCAEYLKKGRHIAISGRLRFEEWQDKTGEHRSGYSITADRVTFLPRSVSDQTDDDQVPSPVEEERSDRSPTAAGVGVASE